MTCETINAAKRATFANQSAVVHYTRATYEHLCVFASHRWHSLTGMWVCIRLQALPFYTPDTQTLKTELEEAIQAAVGCMPVTTADQILDVDVGLNPADFVERLATADYGQYSSADMEQKQCLHEHG